METHKVKFAKYLAKAHNRINDRKESYNKLDKEIDKVRKVGLEVKKLSETTRKRKLSSALNQLKKSMTEVIEAEKMMEFMHRTKSAEELTIEKKIMALEGKLNKYLITRQEKLDRFRELEKKLHKSARPISLPEPEPVKKENLPVKIDKSKPKLPTVKKRSEKEIKNEIKKKISQMEKTIAKMKKSRKYPLSQIHIIEKRIKQLKL